MSEKEYEDIGDADKTPTKYQEKIHELVDTYNAKANVTRDMKVFVAL